MLELRRIDMLEQGELNSDLPFAKQYSNKNVKSDHTSVLITRNNIVYKQEQYSYTYIVYCAG